MEIPISSLLATPSINRHCLDIAGHHDNRPDAQPRRFDRPADALLARLDAFELELLVKLQTIESSAPLPAPRLSPSEILRLVISTALACIAIAGAWLWLH